MRRSGSRAAAIAVAVAMVLAWPSPGDRGTAAAASAPAAKKPADPGAGWPRLYQSDGHSVLLYQPQVDKSFSVTAEIIAPERDAEGVIIAQGGRFGGAGICRWGSG